MHNYVLSLQTGSCSAATDGDDPLARNVSVDIEQCGARAEEDRWQSRCGEIDGRHGSKMMDQRRFDLLFVRCRLNEFI